MKDPESVVVPYEASIIIDGQALVVAVGKPKNHKCKAFVSIMASTLLG